MDMPWLVAVPGRSCVTIALCKQVQINQTQFITDLFYSYCFSDSSLVNTQFEWHSLSWLFTSLHSCKAFWFDGTVLLSAVYQTYLEFFIDCRWPKNYWLDWGKSWRYSAILLAQFDLAHIKPSIEWTSIDASLHFWSRGGLENRWGGYRLNLSYYRHVFT